MIDIGWRTDYMKLVYELLKSMQLIKLEKG